MRISERCFAVTGLGYSTPWCVNAGFIVGDAVTLVVDTGANSLGAATIYGYATAVRPSNRIQVINTEKHFDHIGGNGFFLEQGVEVWGHAGIHRTETEFIDEKTEFNQGIANQARRSAHEERSFDLGGCVAEILFTPGHTETNLSVWTPGDGILFTGDCLINGYIPNLDAGGPSDWRTWLDSLNRVEALEPRIVVTGHGPVARDGEVPEIIGTVRRVLKESIERSYSPTSGRKF
jgi:glyoxylase-like metal-dependent hydrolase (beta-lactamase superfamily II)